MAFEPEKGVFSASYLATMQSYLRAFHAAGMRVTLGLGLENPPSWVFSLPDSTYVDQHGDVSNEADFVFSEAVRQAAASYLDHVAAGLPCRTSGRSGSPPAGTARCSTLAAGPTGPSAMPP